ncbi:DUF1003 domain-containing protein [Pontibacter flavimaris]|uniref:DUF1003 domain-containing protein n=1 Tax=Pontibacter flavimaris TaxID=1797110 RepID=A0A1Q5PHF7_9BACT|nr:DUF1003 domain-containing protein [Pontibacter flavimaris]OKL41664.1 hypothetical protein A3841_11575 [Pontibacter flavimaris]
MQTKEPIDTAPDKSGGMTQVVERNIKALLERKQQEDRNRSAENRIADAITGFVGSMTFVYIHIVFFGLWIAWNTGLLGLEPFDPSLVILAMEASVEAIFLSTFVLISQNRMSAQADKRAELDLQVSLLTEHEVTQLIKMVKAIAQKMDIQESHDPEINELTKNVAPEKVMDTMEKQQEEMGISKQNTNNNNKQAR